MFSISTLVGGAILMLLTGLSTLAPKLCENMMSPNPDGEGEEVESRIVNGQYAKEGDIPYQVFIKIVRLWYIPTGMCGGSILNNYYVITAAHCVYNTPATNIRIVAGTIYLHKGGTTHDAVKSIIHEGYNKDTINNDIALIKVKKQFVFSRYLGPVALPPANEIPAPNSKAVVSGWGMTKFDYGFFTTTLRKTTVFISDYNDCRRALWPSSLDVTNVCSYVPSDIAAYQGQCSGDSGGPVTVNNVLVGIVSWSSDKLGIWCGDTKYPEVNTRVSAYTEWIRRNMV